MGGIDSTPNQREEIEAYRDDYTRELHRTTADGMKTKQVFKFRPLTDKQMRALKNVMANSLVDSKQRKYNITYWNDEDMEYKTGAFYVPDITYTRNTSDDTHIYYDEFEMTIVEY